MTVDGCYKVGYILRPHGLKGEVTVAIEPDLPNEFEALNTVFIQHNERLVPYSIEQISIRGAKAFIKFEDVNTPEEAQAISKAAMFLPKSERPKSGRGEFYDDEVVGFTVIDSELGALGKVREIMSAGANKLLAVLREDREILIPVTGPFITSINKGKKLISVTLPEGFLDI